MAFTSKVDKLGRILIPATLRRRLGLSAGAEVLLDIEKDRLSIYTRRTAVTRAQTYLSAFGPPGESWSEELIAERRSEASRERDE